jgi:cytochrome c biogenesis protein
MKLKQALKGFFYSLGSLQLGITLIVLIIACAVIGTLIPQDLDPYQYVQRYGHKAYFIFRDLGLISIYHNPFFIILLGLLGINLIFCTATRINLKKSNVILIHLSVVIILAGSLISLVAGKKGKLQLYEGEIKQEFISKGEKNELGFQVRLDDFDIEYYDISTHPIMVYVSGNKDIQICNLKIGESCQIKGSEYKVQLMEYFPHLQMENGIAVNKSTEPENPAVTVKITKGNVSETRLLVSEFPHLVKGEFADIEAIYSWQPRVKEYKSSISVLENGEKIKEAVIKVNHPFTYRGYTFYQSNYNPEDLTWSGITVKKDPGVKVVYLGFILLNVSVILNFYKKARLQLKGRR